jgi:hypothetical protein
MHYAWVNKMSAKWLLECKNVMSLYITSYIYYCNKEDVPKVTLPKKIMYKEMYLRVLCHSICLENRATLQN